LPFKNENRFIYYIFGSYYEPHWLSKCMGILRFTNKEDNILSHWKNKRQWIFKWKTDNSCQVYCVLHLLLYIYIYIYISLFSSAVQRSFMTHLGLFSLKVKWNVFLFSSFFFLTGSLIWINEAMVGRFYFTGEIIQNCITCMYNDHDFMYFFIVTYCNLEKTS
jgi:hypothetical protein